MLREDGQASDFGWPLTSGFLHAAGKAAILHNEPIILDGKVNIVPSTHHRDFLCRTMMNLCIGYRRKVSCDCSGSADLVQRAYIKN